MTATGQDSLNTRSTLNVGGKSYAYYSPRQGGRAARRRVAAAFLA